MLVHPFFLIGAIHSCQFALFVLAPRVFVRLGIEAYGNTITENELMSCPDVEVYADRAEGLGRNLCFLFVGGHHQKIIVASSHEVGIGYLHVLELFQSVDKDRFRQVLNLDVTVVQYPIGVAELFEWDGVDKPFELQGSDFETFEFSGMEGANSVGHSGDYALLHLRGE